MTTPNCVLLQSMRSILLRESTRPPRLEIISPYTDTTPSEDASNIVPKYTKKQLDMRRKYEILQHKNNGAVNGNRTKVAGYASLMSNNRNRYTISVQQNDEVVVYSSNACPDDETIVVPTTSSDVPGPREDIYYDPDVPLYNFGYKVRDYAILPKTVDINQNAQIVSDTNIVLSGTELTDILTLIFTENSNLGEQILSIVLPIQITISGIATGPNVSVGIGEFTVAVFHGIQKIEYTSDAIDTEFDKTLFDIIPNEDGTFETTENFLANIQIPLSIGPMITYTVKIKTNLESINVSSLTSIITANDDDNVGDFNISLD
jgi:hypothetical protein